MLKLLLLVLVVGAVAGRCPQGKFWSKVLSECVPCTKCTQSYLLRPCTPEKDSVCADEIKLTLDWLHPSKQVHHFSKDRLSLIQHDLYNMGESDIAPPEKKKPKHFHFPQEQVLEKAKHKKHKKHYEFDDTLADKEYRRKDANDEKWSSKKKMQLSAEDEKALEDWLRVSEDRLKHRKQDLLRNLKHSKSDIKDSASRRLNQPNRKVMSDILNGLVKHELHREGASELLTELELANKAHQARDESDEEDTSSEEEEDQAQRLIHLLASHDSPHSLFLGQPSTVSEIIGQGGKDDGVYKSNVVLEKSNLQFNADESRPDSLHVGESVVAEPFSTTETLVWDWQAVAIVSAVAACLLFFVIAAIYLLLSARDTKRISSDHDGEEMTTMVALMPSDEQEPSIHKPRPIVIAKPGNGLGYVHCKSYTMS